MNTIYKIVRIASTGKWVVASELAKGRKKKATYVAGLAVAIAMASGGSNTVFAASTGNGAIQLCEGAEKGTNGYAIGYGSAGTTTDRCADGSEMSFTMYNNAAGSDGTNGWSGADAGISGYKDGRLELKGMGGLALKGAATFDSDASMQSHKITSLADGALSDSSKDAVNGAQLYATNQNVTTLQSQLNSGATGMVLQDSDGQPITVASGLGGDTVDFTGKKDGASLSRKLTGVSDGEVTSTSKDAVTGAQLYATNKKVSTNADNITVLQDQVSSGAVGLVKQDATTHAITLAAATGGTRVNVAGTEGTRVLSGVANGTADSDAVTIAQLKSAGLVSPDGKPMLALVYDDLAMDSATLGGAGGTVLHNLARGSIAQGSMEAVNGGQLFDFQQDVQSRMSALSGKIDTLNTQVSHIQKGIDDGSMGGSGGSGTGTGSAVMGNGAEASGSGSMAMGVDANASGDKSTASGAHAVASGTGSTALGADSRATGSHAVALGAGSVADRDNTVSVGAAGNERQLTHVAAGTQRTDAANWGQVQDAVNGIQEWTKRRFDRVDRRIDSIGAMSQANAQMAINAGGVQPGGRGRIVAGVGFQGSRSALSVGYANAFSERVRFSIGGSTSSSDASVGAGIGVDL